MLDRIDVISYAMQASMRPAPTLGPCMIQTHMAHSSTLQILLICLHTLLAMISVNVSSIATTLILDEQSRLTYKKYDAQQQL